MSFFAQDTSYWNNKVKNFLHDPPDKALQIPGHEKRSNLLLDALGISATLQAEDYRDEDRIAAGMDRVVLPGYSADVKKNGAVDFLKNPVITHPLGNNDALSINLPENLQGAGKSAKIDDIAAAMQKLLRDDLGVKADGQGLSEKPGLKGDEKAFSPMRFHYLHFLFKKRLAAKNIGGLGSLWPRLPADTRLPDHSIWQHNSLVSALASCAELSSEHQAGIMVFALTPVQDFIAKSRKLRDFWSGSLILSWLAFEGIKVVIRELGADHVLYPSLHDQPMVEDLLGQLGMDDLLDDEKTDAGRKPGKNGVASFPNKFVFLVPKGREAEVADKISGAIKDAWMNLGNRTLALVLQKTKKEDPFIETLFAQQMGSYWDFQWASSPLVGKSDKEIITTLLHKDSWQPAFALLREAEKFFRPHKDAKGSLYSVSHALAQGCLAAGKLSRINHRLPEAGIKCDMFSEYEIIHYEHKTSADQNPPPSQDPFWQDLRNKSTDFKETERLCAIGLVKRLAYRVCQEIDNHPLRPFFKNVDKFPSTTEMAMFDWWQKVKVDESMAGLLAELVEKDKDKKKEVLPLLAQCQHDQDEPQSVEHQDYGLFETSPVNKTVARKIFKDHPVADYQKYYALLVMDGDRLGKLVNGETLGATWGNVLAPELQKRLTGDFEKKHKDFWQEFFSKRRLVAPSTHAAISEALGDFSLHTVPSIINKYDGQLIYAGGDDVCAIMPVSTVVDAAREISRYY
ncbi:MAG: type III-B CRISPR-associated protein Cas10/Cmr2, partial [Pseudomonadota bacterium]|nr:type III-B CRISPR-associated protein Cas10/Cmr2 [Pseudomonadota bacterium]